MPLMIFVCNDTSLDMRLRSMLNMKRFQTSLEDVPLWVVYQFNLHMPWYMAKKTQGNIGRQRQSKKAWFLPVLISYIYPEYLTSWRLSSPFTCQRFLQHRVTKEEIAGARSDQLLLLRSPLCIAAMTLQLRPVCSSTPLSQHIASL